MGRGASNTSGVETASKSSILITFAYNGVRCRETIKLKPTASNIKFAQRKRSTILHEIGIGTFDYASHFPNSKRLKKLGLSKGNNNLLVADALNDYIKIAEREIEYSTFKDYSSIIKAHLIPALGEYTVCGLTPSIIREFRNNLPISAKRANNILIPLRRMLAQQVEDELIEKSPADAVKNLKAKPPEPEPFTPNEVTAILENCEGQIRNYFKFAIWSGLRTSELIALEWGDIDFIGGFICVRRASVLGKIKKTKTDSGMRDVMLLPPALDVLNDQKQHTFLANERIFHNPLTNSPWATCVQVRDTAWKHLIKKSGVKYRKPYNCRHTYASTLLSAGENPMWVAQQMGHKDWSMIIRVYGRWIPEVAQNTGGKIKALIEAKKAI